MIDVPPSVLHYALDPDVTLAVELLLDGDDTATIAKLRWPDLPSYYRAWLAAQQTCAEHALFLEQLWNAVWREVPKPWQERLPGDPIREDMAIDPASVFEYGCFSRSFERPGYLLELGVTLERGGRVQLGVGLWDEDDNDLLDAAQLPEWEQEESESDYFYTQQMIMPLAERVDPGAFAKWANGAWNAVTAAMTADG
ncbi:hypothetical protein [Sphingomonas corticis]|jgi:hypothetical protein|uniref:Uncharacterized protein n=1 Tax=Sphingomonas corticis TaxID=2722791 RepID=A0ABX1CQW7_9SPHN|nr:hypothetical protein [Sphingomonas corticis]NJR80340.1 hypothetical protein [Sphingomonas corticis]